MNIEYKILKYVKNTNFKSAKDTEILNYYLEDESTVYTQMVIDYLISEGFLKRIDRENCKLTPKGAYRLLTLEEELKKEQHSKRTLLISVIAIIVAFLSSLVPGLLSLL